MALKITVAELAMAYRLLALKTSFCPVEPIKGPGRSGRIRDGPEREGRRGKSRRENRERGHTSGETLAWFAGFLPSARPQVAVAVMVPGQSGRARTLLLSRRIFEAYRSGGL